MSHAVIGQGQESLFEPQHPLSDTPELVAAVSLELRRIALNQCVDFLKDYNAADGLRRYAETSHGKHDLRARYGKDLLHVMTANNDKRRDAGQQARAQFNLAFGEALLLEAGYDPADVEVSAISSYAAFRKAHIK